jgi:hypothetical protein
MSFTSASSSAAASSTYWQTVGEAHASSSVTLTFAGHGQLSEPAVHGLPGGQRLVHGQESPIGSPFPQ